MKRIRYDYNETGVIGISRQRYKVKGQDVRIVIHEQDFYFEIIDNNANVIFKGGNTRNVNVLRLQAKRALKEMGCEFGEEKRKPKSTTK